MAGTSVLATTKQPTSPDTTTGIVASLAALAAIHTFPTDAVAAVMIGTTHFTNAVIEARGLSECGIVRLGLPATSSIDPLFRWPPRLAAAIGSNIHLCHGGYEFDGTEISPLRPDEIRRAAAQFAGGGITSVAVSSVFSPANAEQELEVAALLRAELPDARLSLSHETGRIGLLQRENATILNACLRDFGDRISVSFRSALAQAEIDAPIFISQNDGTLMDMDFCRAHPVATFASGPTNSMRGAAFLSGLTDCAVVDIGGTTTDVGILVRGFPRQASGDVDLGGVRTNFRMPDVYSIGIGGGSLVTAGDDGTVRVGPESVGFRLTERGLVFGGTDLTATDLAVAAGRASVGERGGLAHLDGRLVENGIGQIDRAIVEAIDRMASSASSLPVVAVGGGSILLDDHLPGYGSIHRPENFGVANAVGAAIAQIGGEVDRVFVLEGTSRQSVLEDAKSEAVEKAVAAGARASTVEIFDVEEVPLSYLPGHAVRVRIKAVGDLELSSAVQDA